MQVTPDDFVYDTRYKAGLPTQVVSGVASEWALGLVNPLVDGGTCIRCNVHIGGTVELDVVVIHLVAILVREHIVNVLVVVNDKSRNLKVLKDVGHNLGEIKLCAMLEPWQVNKDCLALSSIAEQVVETLTLRHVDGIIGAKEHDVVLVDARPNHVEPRLRIFAIVHDAVLLTVGLEDCRQRSGTVGIAIDRFCVYMVLLKEIYYPVTNLVGATLAHHRHWQSQFSKRSCGIAHASSHKGAHGPLVVVNGV